MDIEMKYTYLSYHGRNERWFTSVYERLQSTILQNKFFKFQFKSIWYEFVGGNGSLNYYRPCEALFIPLGSRDTSWLPTEHWSVDSAGIQYGK